MSSADTPSTPALRASDADRDRVVEQLHAAVADGRLDAAEFDERLDAALAARTLDALAPLTADLAVPSSRAALVRSAEPAPALITVEQKHGVVRREGKWTLPKRLAVRTAWSPVLLDLTEALRTEPELVIDMKVRGGGVDLVLAPGMTVDVNGLSSKFTAVEIDRPAVDDAPQTLHVRVTGKMKHGRIAARWQAPQ
jgi:beta-glucosidase-like glycosyl hydrolase